MSSDNERRDFLKMAGATVAGITITTLAATEADAAPAMMAAAGRPSGARTVVFHCREGVKIDSLFKAIQQAITPFGCPGCGLLGVDLLFHQGDPEPFNVNVPGISANIM